MGSGEALVQPSLISCFPFSPPCPSLSYFLSGRGRGPEREGKGEEGTSDIPAHQACGVRAPPPDDPAVGPRLAGGGGAGMRANSRPQFTFLHRF